MWIKAFRVAGEFYLYSAWNNTIHRVTPRLYEFFANGSDGGLTEERRRVGIALGLLPGGAPLVQVFPDTLVRDALARLRREGPVRLVMTATEACNFRCRYCVFSGAYPHERRHGSRTMPVETALKALRWYFGFRRRKYRVGFYGGEPLLARGLIERVVTHARKEVPPGARLDFAMTTNGWLLDDEAVSFLSANDFDLFISLDGPARVHNRYRRTADGKPTFGRVWDRIRRIQRLHPDYFRERVGFCITLAPPDRLEEIHGFFMKNPAVFGDKVPVVSGLDDKPTSNRAPGFSAAGDRVDWTKLRERYLAQLSRGEAPDGLCRAANEAEMARLARRIMGSFSPLVISGGQCIPGARCHVTPDGTLHACERIHPHLPIGHVDTGYDEPKIEALLQRFAGIVREQCLDCWAIRLCRKCIVDVSEGPLPSPERWSAICSGRHRQVERDLIDYCRARSRDDHCFDSLTLGQDDEGEEKSG